MVGTQIGAALWKQYAGSSKNKKNDLLLGIYPEKKKENINSNRYMHPSVHSHLFKPTTVLMLLWFLKVSLAFL